MNGKAVAYYRISTIDQSIENQRMAIYEYAKKNGYTIVKEYYDEAISGSISPLQREGFGKLVNDIENGVIHPDVVLVYEISRIGRTLRESLDAIWRVEKYAPIVPVSTKEAWLQTLDKSIRDLVLTVVAWAAERERALLIERTKEGLRRARAMGKHIGRPKKELDRRELERYLKMKIPKTSIAKIFGVSRTTLYERLRELGLNNK
jgi:DNA invertase Pin-like site-specific DNA recombinase